VTTQIHPEKCRDDSITGDNNHSSRVEVSERTLSIIAFGFSTAALVTALWVMHEAELLRQDSKEALAHLEADSDKEINRLVHEVNVLNALTQDHDALLMREGLKQPGDVVKGPTGNLEYRPVRRTE
jgi:hypothetical protein